MFKSFPFAFWRGADGGGGGTGLGFRYGYQFDGVDEGIDFSGVNLGLTPSTAFSVSLWVKSLSGLVGAEQLICQSGNSRGIAISEENGVVVQLRSPTFVRRLVVKTINSLDLYEWVNIVVTYDGLNQSNSFSIYFNSVNQSYNVLNNSLLNTDDTNNDTLHFGYLPPSYYYSYKRMDDVQFFDYELTSTNVSDIYNSGYVTAPAASPVHHWKLGEEDTFSTNWTVKDSVGSLDGTSVNMEEEDRKLGVAYSMDFDGVDEYIDFGNVLDLTGTDPFSFSFAIKPSSFGMVLSRCQYGFPGLGYYISVDSNGRIEFSLIVNAANNKLAVRGSNIGLNVWNMCTITYDGSQNASGVKIYSNGVEASTIISDTLTSSVSNSFDFNIGSISSGFNLFNGYIMNVAKFDTELSASDAALLYNTTGINNGVPVDPRDVGLSPTFFAPLGGSNDSFNGTDWTIVDEINGNNGTSVNMEEADKTSETP